MGALQCGRCRQHSEGGRVYIDLVSDSSRPTHTVTCVVKNASDGSPLPHAEVSVSVLGYKVASREKTNYEGLMEIELPEYSYDVEAGREGWAAVTRRVKVAGPTRVVLPMSSQPGPDQVRVVLTWTAPHNKFESMLVTPSNHIVNRTTRETKDAKMELESREEHGPETLLITHPASGLYRYYVKSASARDAPFANSGAEVLVVTADRVQTFSVPASAAGAYWAVFTYDPLTREIREVNKVHDDIGQLEGTLQ